MTCNKFHFAEKRQRRGVAYRLAQRQCIQPDCNKCGRFWVMPHEVINIGSVQVIRNNGRIYNFRLIDCDGIRTVERQLETSGGNDLTGRKRDSSQSPDQPPVKEPPNQPKKPPVQEPEDPPPSPPPPNRPPVKEPPNEPGKPPVKEPPSKDPDRQPPRKPRERAVLWPGEPQCCCDLGPAQPLLRHDKRHRTSDGG